MGIFIFPISHFLFWGFWGILVFSGIELMSFLYYYYYYYSFILLFALTKIPNTMGEESTQYLGPPN